MNNNKIMWLGGALIAYYFFTQKSDYSNQNKCTVYYLVDGQPICETDLQELGYVYFDNMTNSSHNGWYNITNDFPIAYNMLPADWINFVQTAALQSHDINDPLLPNARSGFDTFKAPGATPLIRA